MVNNLDTREVGMMCKACKMLVMRKMIQKDHKYKEYKLSSVIT